MNRLGIFATVIFLFIVISVSLIAPSFDQRDLVRVHLGNQNLKPSPQHILGTDPGGRDMLALIVVGARNSFFIAFFVTITSSILGVFIGIVSGFFGGIIDSIIMRLLDFFSMIPNIMLIIVIISLLPNYSPLTFSIVMACINWTSTARFIRLKTLQQTALDYVFASVTMGTPKSIIMFREILPNISPSIIVFCTISLANNMGLETALTFLGFGLPANAPSLGTLISHAAMPDALLTRPWQWLPSATIIFIMMLLIHIIGQNLKANSQYSGSNLH